MINEDNWLFESRKLDVDSIPEEIQLILPLLEAEKSFVAGGYFRSCLEGNKPKDIDIFFYDENSFNEKRIQFTKSKKYTQIYSTPRSVCFKLNDGNGDILIDLVKNQFGGPIPVIDNFDFTVCKCAAYIDGNILHVVNHKLFTQDVDQRILRLDRTHKVNNPDKFFNRLIRYTQYGYNMEKEVKAALFDSIKSTNNIFISSLGKAY